MGIKAYLSFNSALWVARLLAVLLFCMSFSSGVEAAQRTTAQSPAAEAARREATLVDAIKKNYTPPRAGIIPQQPVLLAGDWEDPDWDTPLMQEIYKNPYSYGNNPDYYLPCLKEALGGNPKAMLALSMFYFLWECEITDLYPDFPPQMHNAEYWRKWAERLTDPGWVLLHLGDLHRRWPESSSIYYREAAKLGNAEAMFAYNRMTGSHREYLYRSAALGYPRAAFTLGEELEKSGVAEEQAQAAGYTWLASLNADPWGLLRSSIAFYNGEYGTGFNNCEQGYLYALLAVRYNQNQAGPIMLPENLCPLSEEQIAQQEMAADLWQADFAERKFQAVMRGRYKREPLIAELRAEMAPLLQIVEHEGEQELSTAIPGLATARRMGRRVASGLDIPWHMGFYAGQEAAQAPQGTATTPANKDSYNSYFKYTYIFTIALMIISLGGLIIITRLRRRKH